MFQGLRTIVYPVRDLNRARQWYTQVLNLQPYFDEPFYIGFNVGGYELGLDPNGRPGHSDGPVTYWGVPDAAASYTRLLELGAQPHEAVHEVGGGIYVGSVLDPFGNAFGIIQNPHFQLPG